jgi:uncharacterized membrane protein
MGDEAPRFHPIVIRGLLLASILLSVLATVSSEGPKVDPTTGQIRVLFMGDALMDAGFVTPILIQDPMLRVNPIPVEFLTGLYETIDDAARGLRAYFPRVERQVVEEYDVIIIADAREPFFPIKIQTWIRNGVVEHGMGFLMGGGPQSFGGYDPWGHPSWGDSIVGGILPVVCLRDWQYSDTNYHLVPAQGQEDHPLVKNIPWKYINLFCRNRVDAKQGSVVVGVANRYPPGSPILTYAEMGEGLSEAFVFDWGGNGPQDFHRSEYSAIIMSNMVYWIARVPIPEDTTLLLRLRTMMTKYFSTRRYVLSVIDFAEKFGANMDKAERALKESDDDRKEVINLYVGGDLDGSLATLGVSLKALDEVSALALAAKDAALMWVYVIEWFTVAGTAMFTGALLWTLMVKRSAYREVGVTRFDNR